MKLIKIILLSVLICFLLLNAPSFSAEEHVLDKFMARKTEIIRQWTQQLDHVFKELHISLKNSSLNIKSFNTEDYKSKAKESLDSFREKHRDKIENYKKEYYKIRGIREL